MNYNESFPETSHSRALATHFAAKPAHSFVGNLLAIYGAVRRNHRCDSQTTTLFTSALNHHPRRGQRMTCSNPHSQRTTSRPFMRSWAARGAVLKRLPPSCQSWAWELELNLTGLQQWLVKTGGPCGESRPGIIGHAPIGLLTFHIPLRTRIRKVHILGARVGVRRLRLPSPGLCRRESGFRQDYGSLGWDWGIRRL